MVLHRDKAEAVGALRLPLGGVNGYVGVRGKQGHNKDKFQGTTPTKKRRTKLFNSAREAAVALAELIQQPQEQDDPMSQGSSTSPRRDMVRRLRAASGRRAAGRSCLSVLRLSQAYVSCRACMLACP